MKFSKCKKLCCLNWAASLVLTNPSDEKNVFEFQQRLELHLKIQLFQLKRLAESYSWGAVLKNKARRFKIFILLLCFILNCQVSPLKLDYWFTHLNANQSLLWSATTASSSSRGHQNNKKTNLPDDQVYSRGISISNAARPARLGETFSRSLSIHFFERAPRAINLDRAKTRVMQHLAAGWLACACACIELNIIFSLMNFPHKSCTFNFNAFEKCVSMLNSQLYYGHRSKCNGFKVFNSRFSKRWSTSPISRRFAESESVRPLVNELWRRDWLFNETIIRLRIRFVFGSHFSAHSAIIFA